MSGVADAGGWRSQLTNVAWGSQAETTMGASTTLPSVSSTPRTRSPSQSTAATRAPVRTVPPAASSAPRTASGTAPLPPTGRPTVATCFMA